MKNGNSTRLMLSVAFGFALIFNVISSSYLEFYPIEFLVGVAFAIGIIMVVGMAYALVFSKNTENPKPYRALSLNTIERRNPVAAAC